MLAQGTSGHVRLRHGWLELPWTATRHEGARLLADWYAAKGTAWLTARTVPLAARAGVTPRGIEAADLGQRWGSCDAAGRITLHWALLQLPPALIDLVLAHELTHLRTAGHGARFRQSMRALLIDLPERERHFAEVEKDLWRGAVG